MPSTSIGVCNNFGCGNPIPLTRDSLTCSECELAMHKINQIVHPQVSDIGKKYPKYYKSVTHLDEIDVYQVHKLFDIQDPSGAIQHASKKLLLSGVRTGNKSQFKDIKEARDTLNRWLEMNHTLEE